MTGCQKDEEELQPTTSTTQTVKTPGPEDEKIPFLGKWTREFEAGPGNLHEVLYSVYQDSIRYTLSGPIGTADYVMIKDTFILENNRFIGHTSDNRTFLVFVKIPDSTTITLYKQEVKDLTEGLSIQVPADSTTQNHGWNSYTKMN
ncbi:hypothetical protein KFE98_06575 [bacterium SCSIO 12741]|nr:hypothetical protein KFE98_06575 [bacterium SCSIO 12741]